MSPASNDRRQDRQRANALRQCPCVVRRLHRFRRGHGACCRRRSGGADAAPIGGRRFSQAHARGPAVKRSSRSSALRRALPPRRVTLKVRSKPASSNLPRRNAAGQIRRRRPRRRECSTFRCDEAMKAMAVAARSYALHLRGRHAAQGYDLCSTTHCQRLEPDVDHAAPCIARRPDLPANCCGSKASRPSRATPASAAAPRKTPAPYGEACAPPSCAVTPTRIARGRAPASGTGASPAAEIAAALTARQLRAPAEMDGIAHRAAHRLGPRPRAAPSWAGRTGAALGQFLPLRHRPRSRLQHGAQRSLVRRAGGRRLTFVGAGEGHGVGMCQLGADQMGVEGHGYREILAFYYPGTVLRADRARPRLAPHGRREQSR